MSIGSIMIIISYILLYFSKNLYLDYFCVALFGAGTGIIVCSLNIFN